ncbi:peptide ABC transporter substrate-binding protein [Oleiphilus sp. HI0009]|uniref:DUF1302 domain-containing protein n=1 Tax=unclassified Oleiphilus TaxID=2631174 RepID=UPI0007C2A70B|nr:MULTISPECIES: DUF1302 domain-containing protein [unclassified Oleiphilus]KZX80765.1 peptide ABC transporter substrate-binding protein [Oleiphilus sp. HI0009]KZY71145.1 peptide ABC transporter substrate-binding protein [Oleiphilus sp. HI0066]KZY75303.1 peptide ABC transporter substrate-binding protein [Oleiphilus sp. HI0067]
MTKKIQLSRQMRKMPLALAVAAAFSTPTSAVQFYIGDYEASIDTTLSAGASWRLEDPHPYNVGLGNGYYASSGAKYEALGASINSDDGNLNFEKGDTFSETIKGSTDFLIQGDSFGAFARVRYWYDFVLEDEKFANDGVNPTRTLSKDGQDNASDIELMDAYVFGDFYLGDMPLSVKAGKQVVSWGESTFIINGINVINPVDLPAFRAPGAEIKDALLPVNMLYSSLGLTENVSLEAFVQLEYEKTRIDDCGTFFSSVDYVADGCGPVYAANQRPQNENQLSGLAVSRGGDILPPDTDQYGAAVRWYVPELNDTEFGFYYIQYHSRFPNVSGKASQVGAPTTAEYQIEYAEDIKLYGISFNTTTPGGVSLSGEYSFKEDMPLQFNSQDLLFAAIGDAYSPVFQRRVSDSNNDGSITDADFSSFAGQSTQGFDRYNVSQLQFTGISFIDQVLGASRLALVGEIGATYVHDLPDVTEIRYGRYDQAGFGLPSVDGDPTDVFTPLQYCQSQTPQGVCDNEGYTTDLSWGYRARAALTYNDVFAGVNLTPTLSYSHDVDGYAPAPGANFIEGRQTIGLSVAADYLNQYQAKLGYTTYFGNTRLNPLSDRDNVSLSVSYSF